MKKIIYISGPMSGLPEMNFPAFEQASKRLRELGYAVISPHEVTLSEYPTGYKPITAEEKKAMWEAFMKEDIKQMMDCDMVATLEGWMNSKGARIEVGLAEDLGMDICEINELLGTMVS